MKHLAKPPPDLSVNHLLAALGDKDDMILTLSFRMAQASIGRHAALPRSLKGLWSIQPTAGTAKPLGVPRRSRGFTYRLIIKRSGNLYFTNHNSIVGLNANPYRYLHSANIIYSFTFI